MNDFKRMKEMVESLKGLPKAKQNRVLKELRNMIDAIGQCVDCDEIACLSRDGLCDDCAERKETRDGLRKKVSKTRDDILEEKARKIVQDNRRVEAYMKSLKIQRKRALDIIDVLREEGLIILERTSYFPEKMEGSEMRVDTPVFRIVYCSKRAVIAQGGLRCCLDGINRLWLYGEEGKPHIPLDTDEDIEHFLKEYVDVRP